MGRILDFYARIFWGAIEALERFGRASLAGFIEDDEVIWPTCDVNGCGEEADLHTSIDGRRFKVCWDHYKELRGSDQLPLAR